MPEERDPRGASAVRSRIQERLAAVTAGVLLLDTCGAIEFANPAAAEILGVEPATLVGGHSSEPRWKAIYPDGTPVPGEAYPGTQTARTGREARGVVMGMIRPDGRTVWISIDSIPVPRGHGTGAVVTFTDVTGSLRAARQIAQNEARYRALFHGASDPHFVIDMRGRFLDVNEAATALLGYTRDELLRTSVEELDVDYQAEDYRSRWGSLHVTGPVVRTVRARHRDGHFVPMEIHLASVEVEGGRVLFAEGRDMSARVAEREQLQALTARLEAVREEEKLRIARDLHDELGQVVTSVKLELGGAEAAAEALGANGGGVLDRLVSASEMVDHALREIQRIALDLRSETLEKVGLEAALRQEARGFARRTGLLVEDRIANVPPQDAVVQSAVFRIAQEALTNVARHALASQVLVRLESLGEELMLEVRDDGRGLTRGTPSRDDLGLIGMRERAFAVGGRLAISSVPGGGTRVLATFSLRTEAS